MTERRNVAASGAIAVLSVLAGTLAVRQWLAGLFSDVGPDRAADMVLLAGIGACVGCALLMAGFVGVWLIVRVRNEREPRAREDVIDAPALPVPSTRVLNVPAVRVPQRATVLTTQAIADDGQRIELGASMDTLDKLRPLVGVTPPTRANLRDAGILSNAEQAQALDWLALHGWVTPAKQGAARAWTDRATPIAFGEWLDSLPA